MWATSRLNDFDLAGRPRTEAVVEEILARLIEAEGRRFTRRESEVEQPLEELRGAVGVAVGGRIRECNNRAGRDTKMRRCHRVHCGGFSCTDSVGCSVVSSSEHDSVCDDAAVNGCTRYGTTHDRCRGSRRFGQLSTELERPQVVTARRGVAVWNAGAASVDRYVLFAVDFIT